MDDQLVDVTPDTEATTEESATPRFYDPLVYWQLYEQQLFGEIERIELEERHAKGR